MKQSIQKLLPGKDDGNEKIVFGMTGTFGILKKLIGGWDMRPIKLFLVMVLVLSISIPSLATDAGVIVIPSDDEEAEIVSLDDLKIKLTANIPGIADITPTAFDFAEVLGYLYDPWSERSLFSESEWDSGSTASFALLKLTILNLKKESEDFYKAVTNILFTFQDKYQYGGWVYQIDSEHDRNKVLRDEEDNYPINPLYEGYFLVGGALPSAVVTSKEPLRLNFNIGEHEITFHIRK